MRDIKFRVWDKKTKKMRQLVNIVFNTGFGVEPNDNTIKLLWVKGKDIIEDKDIQIQREDKFELMQFTGLHDKNGKEIYEGDITDDGYNHIGIVKYGNYNCSCCDGVYGWYVDGGDIRSAECFLEVVGNIYENPDLLKGADNIE